MRNSIVEAAVMEQLEDRLLMSAGHAAKAPEAPVRALPDSVDANLGFLAYDRTFSGTVSTGNPGRDYNYQFSLAAPLKGTTRSFKLTMTGMTGDADIDLLNSSGTRIGESEKWGVKAEKISAKLAAGTYYLHVHIDTYYTNSFSTPFAITTCAKP